MATEKDDIRLINNLKNGDWAVRWDAAIALGASTGKGATRHLAACLTDPHYLVRLEAAKALDKLGWTPETPAVRGLYLVAKREWSMLVEQGPDAVPPLTERLGDDQADIRRQAREILVRLGQKAVAPLLEVLSSADPEARKGAASALGEIGDPRALEKLCVALGDEDKAVRREVALALGRLKDASAVQPLIRLLDDKDAIVRENAAWALKETGAPAVGPLIEALRKGSRPALEALVMMGKVVVDRLVPLLSEPQSRCLAAEALGRIGDHSAVKNLQAELGSPDRDFAARVKEAVNHIHQGVEIFPDD
jgi:HEAT repeat protein